MSQKQPHEILAEIWKHLEKRLDIESLVQEIIGKHSLQTASITSTSTNSQLCASSLHLFVTLKIIFDLQRAYLQSCEPDSRTRAYILELDQLRLTIQYLIHVKSQPCWCGNGNKNGNGKSHVRPNNAQDQEYNGQLYFLAQTLVSGLRALWLHPQQLPLQQVSNLTKSFNAAWNDLPLDAGTSFLIDGLCRRILQELDERPKSGLAKPACEVLRLPDYELGLCPYVKGWDEILEVARKAALFENSDWFRDFWMLYDIHWSFSAALIQLYLHWTQESERRVYFEGHLRDLTKTQATLCHFIATRPEASSSKRALKWSDHVIKTSLVTDHFLLCLQDGCKCFQKNFDLKPIQGSGSEYITNTSSPVAIQMMFSHSIHEVLGMLDVRQLTHRDWHRDLQGIAQAYFKSTDIWSLSDPEIIASPYLEDAISQEAFYIVNCPMLHAISHGELSVLAARSPMQTGLKDLESASAEVSLLILCPRCPSSVSFARRIEPLYQLSNELNQRNSLRLDVLKCRMERFKQPSRLVNNALNATEIETSNPTRSIAVETPTESVPRADSFAVPGSPSRISQSGQKSPSLKSHSSDGSSGKNPFFSFKKKKTNDRIDSSISVSAKDVSIGLLGLTAGYESGITPSYAFSTTGRHLIVWTDNTLIWHDVESGVPETDWISGIQLAAAGNDKCALILKRERQIYLQIRTRPPNARNLHEKPLIYPVNCVCVSPEDQCIAIGQDSMVQVFKTANAEEPFHQKDIGLRNPTLGNQKLSFSWNGEDLFLFSSTRDRAGKMLNFQIKCVVGASWVQITSPPVLALDSDDFGISGCCYDSRNEIAYITTMSQGDPLLIRSPSSRREDLNNSSNGKIGRRVQCATLCPTGDHLLLINDHDEVFLGHFNSDSSRFNVRQKDMGKLKRTGGRRRRDQMMTAVMTSCDDFCLFWIEKGKGTLVRFAGGEKLNVLTLV